MDDIAIGFDLGATNFRVGVFRGLVATTRSLTAAPPEIPATATPVVSMREDIGAERDPDAIVRRISAAIPNLLRQACEEPPPRTPVGVGFAGMLRGREGEIANAPNFGWRDVPLGRMLQEALGSPYRVGVYNDVNAICYGEYALGAGAGVRDLLALFIGTGIGAGAIVDGRMLEGCNNTAAELGHCKIRFDENALDCDCGLKGCVEAYAGGRRLQERVRRELGEGRHSLAVEIAGGAHAVSPSHLDLAAAQGDEYALEIYAEIAPLLAVAIANGITLLNPRRLILGGGMLSRTPVLREYLLAGFPLAVNPPAYEGLEVADAMLGDDAGLVGAALLAGL